MQEYHFVTPVGSDYFKLIQFETQSVPDSYQTIGECQGQEMFKKSTWMEIVLTTTFASCYCQNKLFAICHVCR